MSYEELMDVLVHRRSCRNFKDVDVPDELVRKIIEAGLWCPSAHNNQDSIIVRIKDKNLKERLRKSTSLIMTNKNDFDPFYGAPEILVVARRANRFHADRDLGNMDGTLVMSNMILAAETLGLASCWINTAQINHMFIWSVLPEILEKATGETAEKDENPPFIGVGYLVLGYRNGDVEEPIPRKPGRTFEI